jgi:hypothetical protein
MLGFNCILNCELEAVSTMNELFNRRKVGRGETNWQPGLAVEGSRTDVLTGGHSVNRPSDCNSLDILPIFACALQKLYTSVFDC